MKDLSPAGKGAVETAAAPIPEDPVQQEIDTALFDTIRLKLAKMLVREEEYRGHLEVLSQVRRVKDFR